MSEYPWAERREFLHRDKVVDEYRNENIIWDKLYELLVLKREELTHDNIAIDHTLNEIHFQCVRAFLIDNPEKFLDESVKLAEEKLGSEQNAYICHCAVYAILSKVERKSKSIELLLKVYGKRLAKQVPEWFKVFEDFAKTISSPEYEELDLNPTPIDPIHIPYTNSKKADIQKYSSGYDYLDEDDYDYIENVIESRIDAVDLDKYTDGFDKEGIILFTKLWDFIFDQEQILNLILSAAKYTDENGFYPPFLAMSISEISALKDSMEKKGDLFEQYPRLYELNKGIYIDEKRNLCGGTYRLPQKTKTETQTSSPDTETKTIDKEKLLKELTKYFRTREDAQEFCDSILKAKQADMTKIYAERKHYKKVKDDTSNQAIFEILTKFHVYTRSNSNWNTGIKKYIDLYKP